MTSRLEQMRAVRILELYPNVAVYVPPEPTRLENIKSEVDSFGSKTTDYLYLYGIIALVLILIGAVLLIRSFVLKRRRSRVNGG